MAETNTLQKLTADGFALLAGVFTAAETEAMRDDLQGALQRDRAGSTLRVGDAIYGARNVLDLWPATGDLWRVPVLIGLLRDVLGPRFGLVRVLYFDKPPDQSWALPWHKDMTIAVKDN